MWMEDGKVFCGESNATDEFEVIKMEMGESRCDSNEV